LAEEHIRHLTRILAAFVLLAGISATAWADDFEDAAAAYERGDYETAYRLIKLLAEQGDASAQNNLGLMYANGEGVPQDYAEAVKWYRLAAEQGNAVAQNNLGLRYYKGEGVLQDYTEAMKWLRLAAEQGDARAQSNLGVMYYNGEGVPQDYVQAYMWFSLAVSRGNEYTVKNRDLAASKMTPSQFEEAQRLAWEWLEAHRQ
jgi:TPR repeat protein